MFVVMRLLVLVLVQPFFFVIPHQVLQITIYATYRNPLSQW